MNLAQLRYAPEFRVAINGDPIPAALRASISSVNYQTALEGADRVELSLVNENLRWLDHPLLALDNELTLSIGYVPDPLAQVFVGRIVSATASFPSSGTPILSMAAQDRLQRLEEGMKARWFAVPVPLVGNLTIPDTTVAQIVSAENGLIPIIDPVGAALAVLLGGAEIIAALGDPDAMQRIIRKQTAESDFDFLMRIARENGWEMFIEHEGTLGGHLLRFQSPLDRLEPEVTLRYGQSLIDYSPRISEVGQILCVTACVWVPAIKTLFRVTVSWDWDEMELELDVRPAVTPLVPGIVEGPCTHFIEEALTPVSAPRRIVRELIPKLNQRLTGTGSTIGDPRIRAGTVLRLEGLGIQFGGLYRVTAATHTVDSSGYQTRFEVRKEIWFGSIPLPEQGAVPLQNLASFIT